MKGQPQPRELKEQNEALSSRVEGYVNGVKRGTGIEERERALRKFIAQAYNGVGVDELMQRGRSNLRKPGGEPTGS